jgi:hypothetical protein
MKIDGPDSSKVAAWAAILVGTLTGLATAGVPLFHAATGLGPQELPANAQGGVIVSCITASLAYVFVRLEGSRRQIGELLARGGAGIIVYDNTTSFLAALADATVGASQVSTINSAVPKGVLPALDRYFRLTSRYWSSREASGASFRSVAYVENETKALWLAQRAYESRTNASTSFAVIRQGTLGESATLCFHLVQKGGTYLSFLYPAPDVTGAMQGVCIYGVETYEVLQGLFNRIWQSSIILSSGKQLHKNGFEHLARLAPSLTANPDYLAAIAIAV